MRTPTATVRPLEYNQKMIAAKAKLLERFKQKPPLEAQSERQRLPPGQHVTSGFPVLDLGVRPKFYEPRWRFEVKGAVENELSLTWEQFRQLPRVEQVSDFHCVTTWSKFDVHWSGVKFVDVAALALPSDKARFVIAEGSDYYTTNLPLEDCLRDDVLLADELFGEPLSRDHGGPMRLIVPHLYAWKSAKFLRRLQFGEVDQSGYWEERGYHRRGDPWKEERHG